VHGSGHDFVVNRPLRDDAGLLDNFVRLQVPGFPTVGGVLVRWNADLSMPWSFGLHTVK